MATVSPASLWNLGFEHLYIDSPQLHIRRTAQGRIYVAGLDLSKDQDSDGRAADWFLSQEEFVIKNGSVSWTDELRDLPTLTLEQVYGTIAFYLRNQDEVDRNILAGEAALRLLVPPLSQRNPALWERLQSARA
jgi:hypothetical protein